MALVFMLLTWIDFGKERSRIENAAPVQPMIVDQQAQGQSALMYSSNFRLAAIRQDITVIRKQTRLRQINTGVDFRIINFGGSR